MPNDHLHSTPLTRRTLLTGAAALAAMTAWPKPARADLYNFYAPFGVPIMMPPPSPPGDLIWNPNWNLYDASFQPPIPWMPNPPSSEFITGLVTYLNSHPGWQHGNPHMEDLLRAYHNFMVAQQAPDPTIIPLPEAYFFGGDFGRAFRNNMEAQGTTDAQGLAILVALAAIVGVAGAAAGMIQGMDLNYIAAGLGNGSIVVRVAFGVGLVSVSFVGAAMLLFSIASLVIVVTKIIPQVPKTSGWPIPEGYRMELPVSAWGIDWINVPPGE